MPNCPDWSVMTFSCNAPLCNLLPTLQGVCSLCASSARRCCSCNLGASACHGNTQFGRKSCGKPHLVSLQVRSLPCQPCCHPWLPFHLPSQSRPPLRLPGTLPLSKVTFLLLQIHICQVGELETYSTSRRDKWYLGFRSIPVPWFFL